jgi:predicted RNase H-like HicB family nuclease
MNAGYRIEVAWSDEDQVWIADVPDLAFCSAHGPTPHEAVAEVEQAVDAWIEAAKALGKPVPEVQPRAARA